MTADSMNTDPLVERLTGHCLCGAVTYECGVPIIPPCFCHCESCRRASGAHVVAWTTVPRETFRIVSGTLRSYASSPPVQWQFCEQCGTTITYSNEEFPETIDITITTLDEPDVVPPLEHIWMEDAVEWDQPNDGLVQFERSR
jgi:hypothetical protein